MADESEVENQEVNHADDLDLQELVYTDIVSESAEPSVGLFTKDEANRYALDFLEQYFAQTQKVVDFEEKFVKILGNIDTKIDFFKCRRFLITAINNLKDIDFDLMKGTLNKLYRDTDSLFDFYSKFLQDNKSWMSIFETGFLKRVKPFEELVGEMNLCKATRDIYDMKLRGSDEEIRKVEKLPQTPENLAEIKRLKLIHGGLVHNFATARDRYDELMIIHDDSKELLKSYFEAVFRSYADVLGAKLKYVVNYKAYCLDKLLWYEAENNKHINTFFTRANISGDYNMKTFITFYLKRIDMNKSKDNDWHKYLKELMDILE